MLLENPIDRQKNLQCTIHQKYASKLRSLRKRAGELNKKIMDNYIITMWKAIKRHQTPNENKTSGTKNK